jgi:SLT domain-containing protein
LRSPEAARTPAAIAVVSRDYGSRAAMPSTRAYVQATRRPVR